MIAEQDEEERWGFDLKAPGVCVQLVEDADAGFLDVGSNGAVREGGEVGEDTEVDGAGDIEV